MGSPSWTCGMHGRKMGEHNCLYCCLCFEDLTIEQCHVLPNGQKEDVCNSCAEREEEIQSVMDWIELCIQ